MKRMIISNSSRRWYVDSVKFARSLADKLKEYSPEGYYVYINPQYTELTVTYCPSYNDLTSMTREAVESMGWRYKALNIDKTGYDAAAIADDDRFVYLSYFRKDYDEEEGYIGITYPNGNAFLQDW